MTRFDEVFESDDPEDLQEDFSKEFSDDQNSESGQLYEHFRVVADKGQSLLRVDKFLSEHLMHASRNRIQMAADAGMVMCNGSPVKSNYRVKPLDVITVMMDRPRYSTDIEPEDIPIDVVYEDDCLMVVNKPAGLVVHPGCGNFHGTLVNAVAWHLRDNPDYDPNNPAVGLVHRIDKDTSGLLVIAKTPDAKTCLRKQFFNKTTKRAYQALVWGVPSPAQGTVESQICRNPKDRLQMDVSFDPEVGKHAVTHYTVLERFGYTSLVECRLETGRTHQIRVHMKHLGHPLFSDARYGGDQVLKGTTYSGYRHFIQECFETCPRQALHARTLGFVHPITGQEMFFDSEIPADMAALLDKWRNYVNSSDFEK